MTIDVVETRPSEVNQTVPSDVCSPPRLPVKRSLFGKVDHVESMRFLNQQMEAIYETVSKKWNFDFINERPLNQPGAGAYQWEKVQSDELVPRAYRLSWTTALSKKARSARLHEQMHTRRNAIDSQSTLPKVTVSQPKLTQTSIDGYLKCTKKFKSGGDKTSQIEKESQSSYQSSEEEPPIKKSRSSPSPDGSST